MVGICTVWQPLLFWRNGQVQSQVSTWSHGHCYEFITVNRDKAESAKNKAHSVKLEEQTGLSFQGPHQGDT